MSNKSENTKEPMTLSEFWKEYARVATLVAKENARIETQLNADISMRSK